MKIPPRGGILRHYYFQRIRYSEVINRAVADAIGGLASISVRGNTHAVLPLTEMRSMHPDGAATRKG